MQKYPFYALQPLGNLLARPGDYPVLPIDNLATSCEDKGGILYIQFPVSGKCELCSGFMLLAISSDLFAPHNETGR